MVKVCIGTNEIGSYNGDKIESYSIWNWVDAFTIYPQKILYQYSSNKIYVEKSFLTNETTTFDCERYTLNCDGQEIDNTQTILKYMMKGFVWQKYLEKLELINNLPEMILE